MTESVGDYGARRFWLVILEDANLRGEPVICFSVFAGDEAGASEHGRLKAVEMAINGRRCKPCVERVEEGVWRRVPRGRGAFDDAEREREVAAAIERERAACSEVARKSVNQYVAAKRIKERGK